MKTGYLCFVSLASLLALGADRATAQHLMQNRVRSLEIAAATLPATGWQLETGVQEPSAAQGDVHPIDLSHRYTQPVEQGTSAPATTVHRRHTASHPAITRRSSVSSRSRVSYRKSTRAHISSKHPVAATESVANNTGSDTLMPLGTDIVPATSVPHSSGETLPPVTYIPRTVYALPAADDTAQQAAGNDSVVPLGKEVVPPTNVPQPSGDYLPPLKSVPTNVYEPVANDTPAAGSDRITGLGTEIYPAPKMATPHSEAPEKLVYAQPGQPGTMPAYTIPVKPKQNAQPAPMPGVIFPQPGQADPQTGMPIGVVPAGTTFPQAEASPVSMQPQTQGMYLASVRREAPVSEGQAEPVVMNPGVRPFHALGVQLKIGAAGGGLDLAMPVASRMNIRVGASGAQYHGPFSYDGLKFNAAIQLISSNLALDIFPFGNTFRISPGVTFYNGNKMTAQLYVPGGNKFSLNDDDYTSDPTDPVHGNASMTFGWQAAPSLTIGTGNMIPRSGKHLSFPFEVGVQYINNPRINFVLQGSACGSQSGSYGCSSLETDSEAQADLKQELNDINSDIRPLRFYPILSFGVAWAFHFGGDR